MNGSGGAKGDLALTITGDAQCILPKTALLSAPKQFDPYTYTIAGVPVTATPSLQFYAIGSVSGDGVMLGEQGLKATIDVAQPSFQFQDTLRHPLTPTISYDPLVKAITPTFGIPLGSGDAQVSAGPELTLTFNDYGSVTADFMAGVALHVDTTAVPWWTVNGLAAGVVGVHGIGTLSAFNHDWPIFTETFPVSQAPGAFPSM